MGSVFYECVGCGDRLRPDDEVRAVYRESEAEGTAQSQPERWAYVHLGHEPKGYRITDRGRLDHLERNRLDGE